MAIRARENIIGAWAFLVGVILAVLLGVTGNLTKVGANPSFIVALMVIGIIMGYFVAEKDSNTFLLAVVSVVIVCFVGIQGQIISAAIGGFEIQRMLTAILSAFIYLFLPATIIVAIKTVFSISRS
ncbi:TPA: hypothetical protein ENS27_06550 [bacterium]|nr:hypothetical protein [bacterium]